MDSFRRRLHALWGIRWRNIPLTAAAGIVALGLVAGGLALAFGPGSQPENAALSTAAGENKPAAGAVERIDAAAAIAKDSAAKKAAQEKASAEQAERTRVAEQRAARSEQRRALAEQAAAEKKAAEKKAAEKKAARKAAAKKRAERAAAERAAAERAAEKRAAKKIALKKTAAHKAALAAKKAPQWVLPVTSYHLTGRFGQSGNNWASSHHGLDFAADTGTPIHAVGRGEIISAGWQDAYGNAIEIRHPDGTVTLYGHMSRFAKTGGSVKVGDVIGYVGATGNVTGPHCHLEVRPHGGGLEDAVDPFVWLKNKGLNP
ncbi:Murein DD-endopeptidase MepM and murein hydrolase activator NlpD, contain LysM domain [Actinopolymorpha cephalotaxi]|uniref:Murein DD-endopeptidase MepM and murein hydrolase activator NlpD, contain LysM domain n=1 Tax=Actinopolymorpha cephalotaxi TaxID=504797 RepID=A0A1I3AG52_9ACTN|nr:M23 family metallopeptidase [Actinopolymorpha cephalotaxi]NYH82124.1 murein DD-endopeptidase MepM/ murein hydrolase activator NlpD [Actinopolymorpha cephalotaxi]SFH49022.1 Murein DD-endopeptidase MepM and murein hydrolase activator NlpD, contain LysM domain [Actinopolymorpha cephalotaxi]